MCQKKQNTARVRLAVRIKALETTDPDIANLISLYVVRVNELEKEIKKQEKIAAGWKYEAKRLNRILDTCGAV